MVYLKIIKCKKLKKKIKKIFKKKKKKKKKEEKKKRKTCEKQTGREEAAGSMSFLNAIKSRPTVSCLYGNRERETSWIYIDSCTCYWKVMNLAAQCSI